MSKFVPFVCLAVAILSAPDPALAQISEAHHYDNAQVGVNQLELAYAFARANASIDTSLVVAGAKFNLNQGAIPTHAISALYTESPGSMLASRWRI